jgi:hypothetical protein
MENPIEAITALRVTALFRVTLLSPKFDRDGCKAHRRPRPDRYAFRRRAILFQRGRRSPFRVTRSSGSASPAAGVPCAGACVRRLHLDRERVRSWLLSRNSPVSSAHANPTIACFAILAYSACSWRDDQSPQLFGRDAFCLVLLLNIISNSKLQLADNARSSRVSSQYIPYGKKSNTM